MDLRTSILPLNAAHLIRQFHSSFRYYGTVILPGYYGYLGHSVLVRYLDKETVVLDIKKEDGLVATQSFTMSNTYVDRQAWVENTVLPKK